MRNESDKNLETIRNTEPRLEYMEKERMENIKNTLSRKEHRFWMKFVVYRYKSTSAKSLSTRSNDYMGNVCTHSAKVLLYI